MTSPLHYDYLIFGAGIIGISIARELNIKYPSATIAILEKEADAAYHGSGRNSGVLHAGFYYTANSLKAQFTRDGSLALRNYCLEHNLKINHCGKVVVAQNEAEMAGIYELARRGKTNGVDVSIINEQELASIEPNAKTHQIALYSPTTATVDPNEISHHLKNELIKQGIVFYFNEGYQKRIKKNTVLSTQQRVFSATKIINTAGLYADKIAKDFGFSMDYTIIPFKGIYLKYTKNDQPLKTNIYPVPNLNNPFLGVHYTITVDGTIKIGPTAIPAFWRENYEGISRFNWQEFLQIAGVECKLFAQNKFNFRKLAFEEMRKYNKAHFIQLASNLVHNIDPTGFTTWSAPGIRAQLLNTKTLALVQDFVVEGDNESTHVLNAVSPAFTCSIPFGKWVVESLA